MAEGLKCFDIYLEALSRIDGTEAQWLKADLEAGNLSVFVKVVYNERYRIQKYSAKVKFLTRISIV